VYSQVDAALECACLVMISGDVRIQFPLHLDRTGATYNTCATLGPERWRTDAPVHIVQVLLVDKVIGVVVGMALLALRVQILVQVVAVLLAASAGSAVTKGHSCAPATIAMPGHDAAQVRLWCSPAMLLIFKKLAKGFGGLRSAVPEMVCQYCACPYNRKCSACSH
jgi:hypothetical protein